jgi:hypothetical protein
MEVNHTVVDVNVTNNPGGLAATTLAAANYDSFDLNGVSFIPFVWGYQSSIVSPGFITETAVVVSLRTFSAQSWGSCLMMSKVS